MVESKVKNVALENQTAGSVAAKLIGESGRVKASDKRMINGQTDVNQLVPFKYGWAWQMYLDSCTQHWMPQEFHLEKDAAAWLRAPSEVKEMVLSTAGYFVHQADLCSDAPSLGAYRHITAPECRQYILRQTFEDANHAHAYEHIIDSFNVPEADALDTYLKKCPDQNHLTMLEQSVSPMVQSSFSTGDLASDSKFLVGIAAHFCISRGIHMASGLVASGSLNEVSGMDTTAEIFRTIYRDRQNHVAFGRNVFSSLVNENPAIFNTEVKNQIRTLLVKSVELERQVLASISTAGISKYSNAEIDAHICATANNISLGLGCDALFQSKVVSPVAWAAEHASQNAGSQMQAKASKESLSWD